MGAKSAVKLRKRGVAYKCNHCGRKLMTPDALVAHQRTAHNIISRGRLRPVQGSKPVKLDKAFTKKKIEPEVVTPSECMQITDKTKMKTRKNTVEFECPKCFKRFPTYFPTRKHIQKYHCVDRHDVSVPPHHPNLIRPVRVELCTKCMQKVKSIDTHICNEPKAHAIQPETEPPKSTDKKKLQVCAGCEEWFPSLDTFGLHVANSHNEHIESMFFPTSTEFMKWKTDMEDQTNVSYQMSLKHESKHYYHCNNSQNDSNRSNTIHVCPSIIIVQEFVKGIQVHFYHKHYNHEASLYELSPNHKKYSITSFLQRSEDYNSLVHLKPDEDDLYMQFKTLMEGIVVDAAKINITTLKIILGKALEITSILTNYDEELEETPMSDSREVLTDDQIVEALEEPHVINETIDTTTLGPGNLLEVKRKITALETDISETQEKRRKFDHPLAIDENNIDSPKIVNSFSLAGAIKNGKSVKVKSLAELTNEEPNIESDDESKLKPNGEPSSFNDSYKDFVVKNFPNMESVASRTRSKPIIKTRIGEFKPSAAKSDERTKFSPSKMVDHKNKPVSGVKETKSVRNANEKPDPISVSGKFIDGKPKVVSFLTKTVDEKTKPDPAVKDAKSIRNTNVKSDPILVSGKTVDGNAKSVIISTKIVEDKTKVLPKIDVKIETNFKDSINTRGKAQNVKASPTAKVINSARLSSRTSFDKPKVDIQYEVKERKDDCNILILKI